ncbi:MAG: arginine--tRNA ligase [Bacilli bacterium]|jgi:arginyl-tRNA synthetase
MNIEEKLKEKISNALASQGIVFPVPSIIIEHSKSSEHGDYACNVALQLSKDLHKNPREIATIIVSNIDRSGISKIEIAGPGFINFFLSQESITKVISTIISQGSDFGKHEKNNLRVNVEFVSANPTGSLHLGHARCAAIGDSICRLYEAAGYDVTREYYINDAGAQVEHLGESISARYMTLLGIPTDVPTDGYHGEDIKKIASRIIDESGNKYLSDSIDNKKYFVQKGIELELENIKEDLKSFRVEFDVFSSESKIREGHRIESTIEKYKKFTYVSDGALFLKTTAFLDDKDRPIKKSDGQYTYFMPDIAYHLDKLSRKFDLLVDILGADHHGYIARMKSALMMQGYSRDILEVELVQVVRLMKDGLEVKMSKRTGNAVTLRELCEDVGVDASRYFFVSRAASSHLDFDLSLALEQNSSNPVYYAQYAHARLSKVLATASDIDFDLDGKRLREEQENELMVHLASYPSIIVSSANERAPQKIVIYIQKLASLIHAFYTECHIINSDDKELTQSRLALAKASQIVMRNALDIIGVSAPEKM